MGIKGILLTAGFLPIVARDCEMVILRCGVCGAVLTTTTTNDIKPSYGSKS